MEQTPQPVLSPLRVRVVIPHFCADQAGEQGYGSTRAGNRTKRIVALGRCLGALRALAQRPGHGDWLMQHSPEAGPIALPPLEVEGVPPIQLEILICVTGEAWLEPALRAFSQSIKVLMLQPEDPIQLGLAARDALLQAEPIADLNLYMEDDLVIHDPLFFEKQRWFLERAEHRAVLMPHRYELVQAGSRYPRRFYVDGELEPEALEGFPWQAHAAAASGVFHGRPVGFDQPSNPHSGLFVLSGPQVEQLRRSGIPSWEWIGPLETAATQTVAHRFPVLKPSWTCRDFLTVEHGHHSYGVYLERALEEAMKA